MSSWARRSRTTIKKEHRKTTTYLEYIDIIEGCKEGRASAQSTLVRTFAPRLMAICLRYTKDRNLAQDALQETFVNVFKYIHSYKGNGSFEGWLKRIAVNCSITFQKKIRPIHFADEMEMDRVSQAQIPDIYSTLGKEDILKLLDRLPKSYNMVFNLSVIEGYNHQEIGDILNISASTSRATLSRARAKLIEIMQEEGRKQAHRLMSFPLL